MPNLYRKPPEPPPNPALINAYLNDANNPNANDARRVKAVRALHILWRRWKADVAKVWAEVTAEFAAELEEATTAARRSFQSGDTAILHLHWRLQPALEVEQHPRAVHMMTDRLEQFEVTFDVDVEPDVSKAVALITAKEEELESKQKAVCRVLREHWITKLGAPDNFDFLLQNFLDRAMHVIRDSTDPLAAMRVFWEGAPRRGRRKETNTERDFSLAVAVQKRINAGERPEDAIEAVAKESPAIAAVEKPLSYESIYKIYYRWSSDARLSLASWTTKETPKLRKGRMQKPSCPTDVEQ
jgi:hypothetical protein